MNLVRALLLNATTGALCPLNITLAILGFFATLTLKDWAQIYAGVGTGIWFTVQTVCFLRDRQNKRRRPRTPSD